MNNTSCIHLNVFPLGFKGAEGSTESMVIFICCGVILVMALSMFIKKGVRLCKFYGCSWQLSLSKSAEYDLELDNLHSGTVTTFSQTDMVFSLLLKEGKFRHRWIGIFKKGTDGQTKVILSTAGDTVYCVHEHLAYGTVRTLLGKDYGRNMVQGELNGGVAPYYFFRFALCVVRGIKFLHQYHWIHPGLCIDKLLLTANNNSCKLYNFCHSAVKDLEPRADVSTSFVPLYFPPEHIGKRVYTKKSDVWAVGVVVWEIFSYGVLPPTHADVRSRVDVCRNLKKPSRCPDKIYSAASECWHFNINLRPNLERLEECLEEAFDDHQKIHSNEAFYDIPQVEVEGGYKCYDNVYDRQIL
ncbi:tyrosine-protein kinase CSK-like isoform X2 [Apostichopus japonicus]|uniref:tyrosine-protein kinase CSK-like isoform X2 n=1 Tax=Stichopus japonicus TaxID=307972 RepID=UPI003AB5B569